MRSKAALAQQAAKSERAPPPQASEAVPPQPKVWLSAKVRPKNRNGVDGWIHFHAAYSRAFAEDALREIVNEGDTVLDPFCGSGTTLRAAAAIGAKAVAVDMNPALVALANATLAASKAAEAALDVLQDLPTKPPKVKPASELTAEWLNQSTWSSLVAVREALSNSSKVGSFYPGLLVASARKIVKPAEGSNPTWPKPPASRYPRDVAKILREQCGQYQKDLESFNAARKSTDQSAQVGDAKALMQADDSIDGILTSPPYLSRIDYVRATLPELIALGIDTPAQIAELRREVMGGVISSKREDVDHSKWGASAAKMLRQMVRHESKASKTYYHFLALQYLDDLNGAVSEMMRVLKPGGEALVVVQTSYYKDIHVPLPNIVAELGALHGAKTRVGSAQDVTQHFGHLSPHQRKYVKGKTLREAIVHLSK